MRGALTLGLRILAREWRSGELAVLFLALLVAVSALTGVGFLVDRIDQAMQLQASEVLGADLRLVSPNAIRSSVMPKRQARRGMNTARVTTTLSVVLKGECHATVQCARGERWLSAAGQGARIRRGLRRAARGNGIPGPGEVWPDSRLLSALDARVGDSITVGARDLRVTRVLISRPDQGSGFVDLSPSLLMNDADLASTQLIQPGSRARYAALFAGDQAQVQKFAIWMWPKQAARRPAGRYRRGQCRSRPRQRRAARFLTLASLASVLLCAVAIAMTARRYVQRHLDLAALLKTLGATRAAVLAVSLGAAGVYRTGSHGAGRDHRLFPGAAGCWWWCRDSSPWTCRPRDGSPCWLGLRRALLLLVGFALPPMVQLSRVPAMRVLRKDIGPPRLATILAFGPAVAAVALLIFWVSGDRGWRISFFIALLVATLVLAIAGLLLVWLAGQLRSGAGFSWRFGVANLARRRADSVVQIVALGLGLSVLLLLAIIRGDLIDDWRSRLPQTAPNYFFVNIPASQEASRSRPFLTTVAARCRASCR